MQVIAPFPGHIWEVSCGTGDAVNPGDQLFVIEAMKMETPVLATNTGVPDCFPVFEHLQLDRNVHSSTNL